MTAAARRLAVLAAALAACQAAPVRSGPPLPEPGEGEAWVYLEPLAAEAQGLSFRIAALAALDADGFEVPLHVRLTDAGFGDGQRLLASGALRAGRYAGLSLRVSRARIRTAAGDSDLLVDAAPIRIAVPFTVRAGHAVVLWAELAQATSVESRFQFAPAFTAAVPPAAADDATAWVSSAGRDAVFAFDRRRRRVFSVVPVGAEPRGIARDELRRRLYVALARADRVEVLEAPAGDTFGRIRLELGDRPRDVALGAGGRKLLVLNHGSRTLAFVDPESLVETRRIQVPEDPLLLRVDAAGSRAYVLHASPPGLSVVDVGAQRLVRTIPTPAEPRWAELDRTGRRLYLLLRDSPFMDVYALPELAQTNRVFVGAGATLAHVDPRTDLVYVGDDRGTLTVYDPISYVPLGAVTLPGAPARLELDALEDALLATIPARGEVAVVDLVRRRVISRMDVGERPFDLAVAGGR